MQWSNDQKHGGSVAEGYGCFSKLRKTKFKYYNIHGLCCFLEAPCLYTIFQLNPFVFVFFYNGHIFERGGFWYVTVIC